MSCIWGGEYIDSIQGYRIRNSNFFKWDGKDFHPIPKFDSVINDTSVYQYYNYTNIDKLYSYNNKLIISGSFPGRLRTWDGTKYDTLGCGIGNEMYGVCPDSRSYVNTFATYKNDLYVAGWFKKLGDGTTVNRIARWDGVKWDSLGGGITQRFDNSTTSCNNSGNISAMIEYQNKLIVGGSIDSAGGVYMDAWTLGWASVSWDGQKWEKMHNTWPPWEAHNYAIYNNDLWENKRVELYRLKCECDSTSFKSDFYQNHDTIDLQYDSIIQFTDNCQNAKEFHWHFGDGGKDSIPNPAHQYTKAGTYTVSLYTVNGCCDDMKERKVVVLDSRPTSVKEQKSLEDEKRMQVSIYPNPSNGVFKITIETGHALSQPATIHLYDLMGKEVYSKPVTSIHSASGGTLGNHSSLRNHTETIDISGYNKGIYVLRVQTGEDISYSKVVVR